MATQDPDEPRGGLLAWLDRLRGDRAGSSRTRDGRYVARAVRSAPPPRYNASQRRAGTYGRQARPQPNYAPYAIGFVFIIFALLAFLYVGLDWATGAGRVAGLGGGNRPTPTAAPAIAVPSPSAVAAPSPPVASGPERSYTVKAGDNPGSIAAQFDVSANAIMELNGITDPTKLQVGQTLRIPPAP